MPPLCPRNWGTQRKFGGHAKKISGALRRSLKAPEFVRAPNFKTVSAPMPRP